MLLTIRQFCEKHPAYSEKAMRGRIDRNDHGLADSDAILRDGAKIMIEEERFLAWLDAKNHVSHHDAGSVHRNRMIARIAHALADSDDGLIEDVARQLGV